MYFWAQRRARVEMSIRGKEYQRPKDRGGGRDLIQARPCFHLPLAHFILLSFPPLCFQRALPVTAHWPDEALGHHFGEDIRLLHVLTGQHCDTCFAKIVTDYFPVLCCVSKQGQWLTLWTGMFHCINAVMLHQSTEPQNHKRGKPWTSSAPISGTFMIPPSTVNYWGSWIFFFFSLSFWKHRGLKRFEYYTNIC